MTKKPATDAVLLEIATPIELAFLKAVQEHKSNRGAARALGCHESTIRHALARLELRLAKRQYEVAPGVTGVVRDGHRVKGESFLIDRSGQVAARWVKTTEDDDRRAELAQLAAETLAKAVKGLSPLVAAPKVVDKDHLAVFPIGDPHYGMQAWGLESGDDFDLKIARQLTVSAVDRLMRASPDTETALIVLLGDTFHMDDQRNVTPGHGHQLDADGRFAKVVQVAIEAYRHTILRALEKYKKVMVRVVRGNHDPHAHLALAYTLQAFFHNQPRVQVDLSPADHWYYRFDKVLIGFTHGDKAGHDRLPGVMACDRAKDWGETTHRYWYTGHVHSQNVREYPGVVCESFRTLAAKDAFAAGYGYRAGRDMVCIIHHRLHGEVERYRCDVGMLRAA